MEEEKDYEHYIELSMKKKIISENVAMHEFIDKQKIKSIVENVLK